MLLNMGSFVSITNYFATFIVRHVHRRMRGPREPASWWVDRYKKKYSLYFFHRSLLMLLLLIAIAVQGAPTPRNNQTSGLGVINGRTTNAGTFNKYSGVLDTRTHLPTHQCSVAPMRACPRVARKESSTLLLSPNWINVTAATSSTLAFVKANGKVL